MMVTYWLIGGVAGILSELFGIGGGLLIVPGQALAQSGSAVR